MHKYQPIYIIKLISPCCITSKRVTSLRGPSPSHCARATQLLLKKCRCVGNTVSDLTDPRSEPKTSRSIDEHVTARPTFQENELPKSNSLRESKALIFTSTI